MTSRLGDRGREYRARVPQVQEYAMCSICKVHCATWRTEDADADGHWTLDACDAFGQRWLVHHDDLLEAVVLLGDMIGVDWEDG